MLLVFARVPKQKLKGRNRKSPWQPCRAHRTFKATQESQQETEEITWMLEALPQAGAGEALLRAGNR
jgi:hypothetical protein